MIIKRSKLIKDKGKVSEELIVELTEEKEILNEVKEKLAKRMVKKYIMESKNEKLNWIGTANATKNAKR